MTMYFTMWFLFRYLWTLITHFFDYSFVYFHYTKKMVKTITHFRLNEKKKYQYEISWNVKEFLFCIMSCLILLLQRLTWLTLFSPSGNRKLLFYTIKSLTLVFSRHRHPPFTWCWRHLLQEYVRKINEVGLIDIDWSCHTQKNC